MPEATFWVPVEERLIDQDTVARQRDAKDIPLPESGRRIDPDATEMRRKAKSYCSTVRSVPAEAECQPAAART